MPKDAPPVKTFDAMKLRSEFPILLTLMNGKPLCYLDNASTMQKPRRVIEKEKYVYERMNANVHRGAYALSMECTEVFETVRAKVSRYLGKSADPAEVIFTSGTTDSVNLVASTWGRANIEEGSIIAVTRMEHHSNFVPWQQLAIEKNAKLLIIDVNAEGRLDEASLSAVLGERPRLLALTAMSNVLGTVNPVAAIAARAKEVGTVVFVDAAQAVAHVPMNGSFYGDADFIAFSSHKIGGPTGVGVLWAKRMLLDKMPPYRFGGDMIRSVRDERTTWNELPWKFEAGTPNYTGVIAMGEAIDLLMEIGMERIQTYETKLAKRALERLSAIEGVTIQGPKTMEARGAVISFEIEGVHPHDLATFLDLEGIAVRAGHHCAQPLMCKLGIAATARASFAYMNLEEEVDRLAEAVTRAIDYFHKDRGKIRRAFEERGRA